MSRKNSLSRIDFSQVAAVRGARVHGKLFTLVCGNVPDEGTSPKIACVVSAKAVPRAVDRNLVKRRCKAAAREAVERPAKVNAYIFYAKPPARTASYKDIKEDIASLLDGINSKSQIPCLRRGFGGQANHK